MLLLLVVGFLRLLVVSVRVGAKLVRASSWLLVLCWLLCYLLGLSSQLVNVGVML